MPLAHFSRHDEEEFGDVRRLEPRLETQTTSVSRPSFPVAFLPTPAVL